MLTRLKSQDQVQYPRKQEKAAQKVKTSMISMPSLLTNMFISSVTIWRNKILWSKQREKRI
uniref:Uncharacterized protein n=1 Tax=Rhizophora mucronata TaxID=61149 RepID=A0A2P2NNB7_RHIMU